MARRSVAGTNQWTEPNPGTGAASAVAGILVYDAALGVWGIDSSGTPDGSFVTHLSVIGIEAVVYPDARNALVNGWLFILSAHAV